MADHQDWANSRIFRKCLFCVLNVKLKTPTMINILGKIPKKKGEKKLETHMKLLYLYARQFKF